MDSTQAFTMTDPITRHKRARVSRACDQCRRKKIRCDADKSTPCTNCRTYGFGCSFLDSAKKRGPPKGYIEALENRLKRMESLLGGLVDGVERGGRMKRRSIRQEEDEEEDDEVEDENDDDEEDDDSASSSHSTHAKGYTHRRHRGSDDMTSAQPMVGMDTTKLQHLNALSSPPQTPEEPVEDINENLEKLNMTDYTRYVGNSSGLYLFTSQFESKDGIYQLPPNHHRDPLSSEVCVKEEPECGLGVADFRDESLPGLQDLGFPSELIDRLVDIFFTEIHPLYPIINKVHFFKQRRGELSTSPPPALVFAILTIASRYLPEDEPSGSPDYLTSVFSGRTYACFGKIYMHPRVSTVQALILMSLYYNCSAEHNRHWLYSGLAIRMAQELGLHRSSANWKIPKSEIETRKRVWWACYLMDRWAGATFGRILLISDDDCDVEYPSIYEEDDEDMSTPSNHSQDSFSPEPLPHGSPPAKKPSVLHKAFVELIKVSEILGHVMQSLYTPMARKRRAGHDKIIKSLDDDLANWKLSLSPELQWQKDDNRNIEVLPYIGSLHLSYYTVLILLHRPYIPSAKALNPRSQFPSLRICTSAAGSITKIAQSMQASGFLESSWPFAVYNIFQASLIHMHNTTSPNSEISRMAKSNLQTNIQIMEVFQRSFANGRKIVCLLTKLSKGGVSFEEPAEGGVWISVSGSDDNSFCPSTSMPLAKADSRTPALSRFPGFVPTNAGITNHQHTDSDVPMSRSSHTLNISSLSTSSPLIPSSNPAAFQMEPAFSLRQFTYTPQQEFPSSHPSVSFPMANTNDGTAFTLNLNGTSGELPNELFRIDQSNPFLSMPSTYNPEDWDMWMVEHGATGAMNVATDR